MHALVRRHGAVEDDGSAAGVDDMLAAVDEGPIALSAGGRGQEGGKDEQHNERSHGDLQVVD